MMNITRNSQITLSFWSVLCKMYIYYLWIFSYVSLYYQRNSLEFCHVLQEFKGHQSSSIYAEPRLYILCFDSLKEMNEFIEVFTINYILYIDSLEVFSIMPLESGRSLKIYYDKFDYKNVLRQYSIRFLANSIAFYNYQTSKNAYCLQEGFTYSSIKDCNVTHGHFLNLMDIKNNPNVSCCVFYNRTWDDDTMTLEYICSMKSSLEICVWEAKVIQKEMAKGCFRRKELEKKNMSLVEVWEEFLSEDEKIKEHVSLEPRERGNLLNCGT